MRLKIQSSDYEPNSFLLLDWILTEGVERLIAVKNSGESKTYKTLKLFLDENQLYVKDLIYFGKSES